VTNYKKIFDSFFEYLYNNKFFKNEITIPPWKTEVNLECTCYDNKYVVLENMIICKNIAKNCTELEQKEEIESLESKYEKEKNKIFIEVSDFFIKLLNRE